MPFRFPYSFSIVEKSACHLCLFLLLTVFAGPVPTVTYAASPNQNEADHRPIWSLLIFEIQQSLKDLDAYHGPLDGFSNPDFLSAILRYQELHGLPQDGIPSQELLEHLRIKGRSGKLLADLAASKKRNQDSARESLLAQDATKDLLAYIPNQEVANAARDKKRCLTTPTVSCLINEALESAKAVNKAEYRRWVYREVMKAQTYAGMDAESRQTIRRLEDPRLILVALQEQVHILAQVNRIPAALELANNIPNSKIKAKALSFIYLARPDQQSLGTSLIQRIAALDAPLDQIDLATSTAIQLWQKEAYQPAINLMELARQANKQITEQETRKSADLLILSAETKMGNIKSLLKAAEYYESQDEYRYLVIALSDLAQLYHLAGRTEQANQSLDRAFRYQNRTKGFPAKFTLAKLSETLARMNRHSEAIKAADKIDKASLRARTFWNLANLNSLRGQSSAIRADYLKRTLSALQDMTNDFDKISLLSQIILRQLEMEQDERAHNNFQSAIKLAHNLKNNWWRARAFSRLAMIRAVLEKEG